MRKAKTPALYVLVVAIFAIMLGSSFGSIRFPGLKLADQEDLEGRPQRDGQHRKNGGLPAVLCDARHAKTGGALASR